MHGDNRVHKIERELFQLPGHHSWGVFHHSVV